MEVLYLWLSGEDERFLGRMLMPRCGPYQAITLGFYWNFRNEIQLQRESIIQIYTVLGGKSCEII